MPMRGSHASVSWPRSCGMPRGANGASGSPVQDVGYMNPHHDRYDFFYKNGVPRWRGTGYYYSRFRPGLGVSFAHL